MKINNSDLLTKHWGEITELVRNGYTRPTDLGKIIFEKYNYYNENNFDSFRRAISTKLSNKPQSLTHPALNEECDAIGLPIQSVKNYWYKGEHFSINVNASSEVDYVQAIGAVLENYTYEKKKFVRTKDTNNPKAIKATLSDMHVGLNPNPNNKSLFGYEYNAEIFNENIDKVINSIVKEYENNGVFDLLLFDDLGDGLDGYNGLTTRGGHGLEQNMSNEEAFKTYIEGKLRLIETVIDMGVANKYHIRNVSDCNHSGSFGAIANMAIKMILERVYEKGAVEFTILERFMEHFVYGEHTFILTHGKDSKYMFKGLPYTLNDKTISFINEYIEHYGINTKYIHLEKGDLHRIGYDRTKKFDYRNFMSFAPPSAWVQGNFGDGYSGYSIQIVPKYNGEIQHTDYYIDLRKK
jgi:hypothetical protein